MGATGLTPYEDTKPRTWLQKFETKLYRRILDLLLWTKIIK